MSSSLYEWGLSRPWCITHEALDLMLALAARDEVDTEALKQAMHGPKALALRDGKRRDDSAAMTVVDGVARLVIDGPIYRYADFFTSYSGGVTTESLARDLQKALDDPAVGAIALVIDSPGGDATGINELSDAIYAARGRKPIGAYVEGYGASAAYWIASAVDPGMLVVDDTALLGSIGTILGVPDPSKRPNTRIDIVSTQSPKKRVDPTTPDGRAVLQTIADDMTDVFIAKVMRNRDMTRQQVLDIEGGLRIGEQAIAAKLADRLGSEDQLLRELGARALSRQPYISPPARVPGGNPLKLENTPMQIFSKEWWANLFAAQAEAEGTPIQAQVEQGARTVRISAQDLAKIEAAATSIQPVPAAAPDADDPRIAELQAQIARLEKSEIESRAAAFTEQMVRENRAFPAEAAELTALYTRAALDDRASPAEGTTRVASLEGLYRARQPHQLTQEVMPDGQHAALTLDRQPSGLTEAGKAQLLSMTQLGRQTLARTTKSA